MKNLGVGVVRGWVVTGCLLSPLLVAQPAQAQLPEVVASSDAQVHLGRLLFWDPILSGGQDVACATCHHPDFAWADGRELSLGPAAAGLGPDRVADAGAEIPFVKRNSQSILNTAYNGLGRRRGRRGGQDARSFDPASAPMFWDSRVRGLEAHALEPIKAFEEMRGHAYPEELAVDSVVTRLGTVTEYVQLFNDAFGERGIASSTLAEAVAAYQRTLIAVNSPWDRFQAGDDSALSAQQLRGMTAFNQVGCNRCHGGPMFSDYQLHAEGVMENPLVAEPDTSDGRFRFRTPTLRNVELTAPYMHNGMLASLEDVLLFYHNGRSENPNVASRGGGRRGGRGANADGVPRVDRDFRRVANMSARQREDIIAFLKALTDEDFDRTVPGRVPSGLTPGGSISH